MKFALMKKAKHEQQQDHRDHNEEEAVGIRRRQRRGEVPRGRPVESIGTACRRNGDPLPGGRESLNQFALVAELLAGHDLVVAFSQRGLPLIQADRLPDGRDRRTPRALSRGVEVEGPVARLKRLLPGCNNEKGCRDHRHDSG